MKQTYLSKIFVLLLIHYSVFAQQLDQNISTVSVEIYYNYQIDGEVNRILSTFFLPQNLPNKQRVINIECSLPPHKIFESGGNQYIEFVFDKPKESFVLKIEMDIELYRYDLRVAAHNQMIDNTITIDKYLRNELFLKRKNKNIREVAANISGDSQLETVQNIYSFVVSHLEYDNSIRENLGAIKALKKGHGDCTEYADLFVTLCRAKDIPARVVAGCVAELSANPNHHWTEVYLEDMGWVPFDPTYGDSQSATFEEMPNQYIYYSNNRTDKVLFSGNGRHKWWIENRFAGDVSVSSFYDVQYPFERKFGAAKSEYLHQNYAEANELIDDLLTSDSKNSRYHAFKSLILAQQDDFMGACKSVQGALILGKNNNLLKQNAYYTLSNICALQGQKKLALSFLKQVVEMGVEDLSQIRENEDFAVLRGEEDFEILLK
ncbi:MAG: transglutaminase domain-containing protein [Chitinophagales bacterium]